MQPTICSRCKKNVAVIFISRMENGKTINEGLCLKCAKELNIKPVDDIMQKMGISEEDLDGISNEMLAAFGGAEGLEQIDSAEEQEDGKTATFPFLNKLFGSDGGNNGAENPRPARDGKERESGERRSPKRKFLENYAYTLWKDGVRT